jgi:hypothetical protein
MERATGGSGVTGESGSTGESGVTVNRVNRDEKHEIA